MQRRGVSSHRSKATPSSPRRHPPMRPKREYLKASETQELVNKTRVLSVGDVGQHLSIEAGEFCSSTISGIASDGISNQGGLACSGRFRQWCHGYGSYIAQDSRQTWRSTLFRNQIAIGRERSVAQDRASFRQLSRSRAGPHKCRLLANRPNNQSALEQRIL